MLNLKDEGPVIRVLFADDSETDLELMRFYTEHRGWYGEYVNGVEALLDAVNRNCPEEGRCFDCIVTDINFKDSAWTGITAIRAIRKVRETVPVVFVSGWVNSMIREEGRRIGAEVIAKPFDFDILFDKIEQLVLWHRLSVCQSYDGETDRRRASLNQSDWSRRKTDNLAEIPKILTDIKTEDTARLTAGHNK